MHTQKQSMYGRAERMPNSAFRIMSLFLSGREKSAAAALTQFGIRPGDTVVDFGCGPGAYIRSASGLAGAKGRVYAVDIHPLAIKAVERKIKKIPAEERHSRAGRRLSLPSRRPDGGHSLRVGYVSHGHPAVRTIALKSMSAVY